MGLMTREEGVTKRKSSSHLHSVQLRLWQVPLSSSKIPRAYTRTIFKERKITRNLIQDWELFKSPPARGERPH